MQYELLWKQQDLVPVVAISLTVICFSIYWMVYTSEKVRTCFGKERGATFLYFTKYFGFAIMGICAFIVAGILIPDYTLEDYGVCISRESGILTFIWLAWLCPGIFLMNWLSARRRKFYSQYPQIRYQVWSFGDLLNYSFSWCVYLFGYEFLFRGLLLMPLADSIGVWPAIAVNLALYSVTHIMNGWDEAIGAIPLGLILCLATLHTGTIWVAYFTHVFLALSSNLLAIWFNPEMKVSS